MNGKWPPIVSMLPLSCYFILWDLPHFTCFGCYPSFLQCHCLFIQTTLISRNVYDKNIVFLSSISTDYSWILPVIPWKHEILMLLYVSFSFSIKLLVNLFSVRNLQYFLWRFLCINILFLNFVPHFSFLFKTPFLTLKISSYLGMLKQQADVVHMLLVFCFYRRKSVERVYFDQPSMPVPPGPSLECPLLSVTPLHTAAVSIQSHFVLCQTHTQSWSSNCTIIICYFLV